MPPPPPPPSGGEVGSWDSLRDTAERAPTITLEASDALIGVVDKWIGRGAMYNSLDRILGDDNTPEVSEELFRGTYLEEGGSFSQYFTDRLREKVFFDDKFNNVDYELVCEAAADMIRVASGGVEGVNAADIGLNVFRDLKLPLSMLERAVEMCPREASHVIAEMVSKKHLRRPELNRLIQVTEHIAETPSSQWRALAWRNDMIACGVYGLYGDIDSKDDDVGQEAIEGLVECPLPIEKRLFGLRKEEYKQSIEVAKSKEEVKQLNRRMIEDVRDIIASAAIPKTLWVEKDSVAPEVLLSAIKEGYDRNDLLVYGRNSGTGRLNNEYFFAAEQYLDNILFFEDVARFVQKGLGDFTQTAESLQNMRDILDHPEKYADDGITVRLVPRSDWSGAFRSVPSRAVHRGELLIRIGDRSDARNAVRLLDELQLPIGELVIGGHGDKWGIEFGESYRYSRDGNGNEEIDALIRRVRKDGVILLRSCSSGVQYISDASARRSWLDRIARRTPEGKVSTAEVVARKHGRTVLAVAGVGGVSRLAPHRYDIQYVDEGDDWSDAGARQGGYIRVEPGYRVSLADGYTTTSALVADRTVDIKALRKERKHGN